MAGKDMVVASRKELKRLHVIQQVVEKKVRQKEAVELLGMSERQIRRMVRRVREEGEGGICHQGRGKPSNRCFGREVQDRVLGLYREHYAGFGPTLASEKLLERDGITVSDETLRLWLKESGETYPQRKKRPHRQWRERKGRFGEMVQMDGSHHDWLEGRGPWMVLMGYIDDATGETFGRFYEYEGTIPAMDSFHRYIKQYGVPMRVYSDKHTTYKSPAKPTIEDDLAGRKPMSQFEQALSELEVVVIHAHSPQAKGRVERLFRTLQDRLVKELRLLKIRTLEEANTFLTSYWPKYNQKFRVVAASEGDLHRPIPADRILARILCIHEGRVVRNDGTITYEGKFYQIEEDTGTRKVVVEERTDGTFHIMDQDRSLKHRLLPAKPVRETVDLHVKKLPPSPKRKTKPTEDHPWRKANDRLFETKKRGRENLLPVS